MSHLLAEAQSTSGASGVSPQTPREAQDTGQELVDHCKNIQVRQVLLVHPSLLFLMLLLFLLSLLLTDPV